MMDRKQRAPADEQNCYGNISTNRICSEAVTSMQSTHIPKGGGCSTSWSINLIGNIKLIVKSLKKTLFTWFSWCHMSREKAWKNTMRLKEPSLCNKDSGGDW